MLDLLYPVALGSSAAVPGGFGTGKTVLLQQVAKIHFRTTKKIGASVGSIT